MVVGGLLYVFSVWMGLRATRSATPGSVRGKGIESKKRNRQAGKYAAEHLEGRVYHLYCLHWSVSLLKFLCPGWHGHQAPLSANTYRLCSLLKALLKGSIYFWQPIRYRRKW